MKENQRLEWKETWRDEFLRWICGFANADGGVLLFHGDPERFVSGAFVKVGFFRSESDLAYHDMIHGDLFTQVAKTIDLVRTKYLLKGFTMDDERLKNPPGKGQKDYFDEQLERIRDIRSSERRFYQKVLDIYATSVDYTPNTEMSQQFFATV